MPAYETEEQRRLHALEVDVAALQKQVAALTSGMFLRATGQTRALSTAFQPYADRPCLVIYTVECSAQSGLLTTQTAQVDLQVARVNSPEEWATTSTALVSSQQVLGLSSVGIVTTERQTLVHLVPTGYWVQMVPSGGGTSTLVSATELIIDLDL